MESDDAIHILPLHKWGDPVLRSVCTAVPVITPELIEVACDMVDTMYHSNGVGLAAPQVGRTERLCVIDVPEDAEKEEYAEANAAIPMPLIMFNPMIIESEGTQTDNEGCLSFPSIPSPVTRANKVTFTFTGPDSQRHTYTAYGLLARAVQHELDHLDGRLFIDYVLDRTKIAAKLDKLEAKTKRALGIA